MRARLVCAFAAVSLFAGCAIHPLPEDVARANSFDIVRQIRCETRDTVREAVIGYLDILANQGSVTARQLASQYRSDPASIRNYHYNLLKTPNLPKEAWEAAKLFYDTGIAYTFDFAITEDNDFTADLGFLKQRPFSKVSLGINAGAKRKRANERIFTVTDTFSGLLTKLTEAHCEGQIVGPNYAYPISGRIGVDKLVNDFIYITLFENLAGKDAKPGDLTGPPTMVDNLAFTTAITASANPSIVFTPITPAFQLASASINALADRIDIHKVTIGLALSPTGLVELAPLRSYLFGPGSTQTGPQVAQAGPLYVGARVIGGGTPAERLAVIAVDQVKSREVQLIPPP
jgi:hypothetical protein